MALVEPFAFPLARMLVVLVTLPEHTSPIRPLFWMVTSLRVVRPPAGGLLARMPPHEIAPRLPEPLLLTVVFRISNAAPLSSMPPPGLLITAQVSMWRVTVELGSGAALIPIPVAGLAVP